MATRLRSEAGFTLVELLVAVTALGIIMLALANGAFIAYRTMDRTGNSLTSSADAQYLAIYLPSDVKSADVGTLTGITCTGVTISNPELMLTSNANATAGLTTSVVVVYWVKAVTGGFQLIRSLCGSTPSSIVVARNLDLVTSADATATTGGYKITITDKKTGRETTNYAFTVSGRFRTGITT